MVLKDQLKVHASMDLPINFHKYVLENGVEMKSAPAPINEDQVRALQILSQAAQGFAPKQCFHNAQMLVLMDPERFQYHEGYVWLGARSFMPILHAWVVMDKKFVIDVTLSTREDRAERWLRGEELEADLSDRMLGVFPEGWEYIGVPIDNAYVIQKMIEDEETKSLIDNWKDDYPLIPKDR
jgi:hypothetical protein